MSFSLYYEAKRPTPLTSQEQLTCQQIINKFSSQYPFDIKIEDFTLYPYDKTDIVFNGSTKLPDSDPQLMYEVATYWLNCLTEITNILPSCQWSVTFEEVPLIFDFIQGWRFPADDEYN